MTGDRLSALMALGLATTVAASWWSCGSDEGSRPATGGGGTGGIAGSAATGGSDGGGSGGLGATGGVTEAGAPCPWEGWYQAPRMPPDCTGLCIPDDPVKRLPKLTWSDHNEFCKGCKWLDTPWMPADAGPLDHPVSAGVFGQGEGPTVVGIGMYDLAGTDTAAYFSQDGTPIAAWRGLFNGCGYTSGLRFSQTELVAHNFRTKLGEAQHFVMRPISNLAELMAATDTTLTWPASFVGQTIPLSMDFSSSVVAANFMGRAAIGQIATGATSWVDELPGSKPGEYTRAHVVGDAVIVSRFAANQTEWLIVQNGKVGPYLGTEDKDIEDLVTDGQVVVWNEGTNPSFNDFGVKVFGTYSLYASPFNVDPSKLTPKLLLTKVSGGLYWTQLQNGYLSGVYYRNGGIPGDQTDALVVRFSDGWAARSQLPWPYSWGSITFPAPTELWGGLAVDATSKGTTIVRFPYSSMEVLQTAAPASGG